MSIIEILETILIGPLKLVFEIIYVLANRIIGHPGLSIIVLSLIMNILVLPLYRRADEMQEKAKDIEEKLHDGVAHIKKTFTGDERMMILQTYYRQNNYKPTDALNGSVSLLLEVPFFMAAYQFLSTLTLLEGVSLGPIADLSKPDGLLVIGSLHINLLPVIMTLVNVISSALYLKGYPLKTKIQLYGMAGFFLVFLYTSPSGLVFYWTLNNLFSLVKTVFSKLKNPKKILTIISSLAGIFLVIYALFIYNTDALSRKLLVVAIGAVLQIPAVFYLLSKKLSFSSHKNPVRPNRPLFMLGVGFLIVLLGLLIPSTYIAASPQEYINPAYFYDPIWYVVSALCLSVGFFGVWLSIFYWLSTPKIKTYFEKFVWIFCGIALVNYMFFGTNLGIMSSTFQFENVMVFPLAEKIINLLVLFILSIVMFLLVCRNSKIVKAILLTAIIALGGMSVLNMVTISNSVDDAIQIQDKEENNTAQFQLSKTGKNVVVIMLDRAMGEYVPYIFNEKPELKEQFSGFTYFSNVISHGGATIFSSAALYGGYEYTPVELNKRGTESLASKQNEALKVLPVLFSQNNYSVTVFDPPYANFNWHPDISIFKDYPDIDAYIYESKHSDKADPLEIINTRKRNVFCLSLMKSIPLVIQPFFYAGGNYYQVKSFIQSSPGISTAVGVNTEFNTCYAALSNLSNITSVSDEFSNTYVSMTFQITHNPTLLRAPDYTPALSIDNTQYDRENADRFLLDGQKLIMEKPAQMKHYHVNMASFLQIGQWLDTLRENGVYDNTRIILVSDHGYNLNQISELIIKKDSHINDVSHYFPLLMIKDFESTEFATSDQFMTIADVPTLATDGLIESPVNPFTGKPITSHDKQSHDQLIMISRDWDVGVNNGKTFLPCQWASVHDDLWNPENWTFYDEEIVLTEHELPEQ